MDSLGKRCIIMFSAYLSLLAVWSVLNGTLLSEGMMIGFRRWLAWFSLALYGCFVIKKERDILCVIDLLIPFLFSLGIYGIYCYMTQSNPLLNSIFTFSGVDDNMLSHFSQESRGGLTGRIQGLTSHPLVYSGQLLMAFFLFLYRIDISKRINSKYVLLEFLILLNLLMTGCRSAIIGLAAGGGVYLLLPTTNVHLKKSITKVFVILCVIALLSTSFVEEYRDFINSIIFFWKDSEVSVRGSSLSLRISQLISSFALIGSGTTTLLFGLGHDWCEMYALSHNGMHPDLYGFESIIFVGLIELGIVGFLVLTLGTFNMYFFLLKKYGKSSLIFASIIAYLTFEIFTGEYSTDHFLIFTLLMIRCANMKLKVDSAIINRN